MTENVNRGSGTRPKKRKFSTNRYTHVKTDVNISASSKKLKMDVLPPVEENTSRTPNFDGYRLFDVNLLITFMQQNLSCKSCGDNIVVTESSLFGLSSKFEVTCQCSAKSFRSCTMLGRRKNIPEINRRFTYAMRMLGQGRAGMETFCCGMDLPPPIAQKSYTSTVNKIVKATSETAEKSMKKAAQTEAILSNSSLSVTVSGDGTWKTRGHTSLTGVCTIIGAESGKVIETEVMSSYCKMCESSEAHDSCNRNHFGSAGKMEVDGMIRIFSRSEKTRGIKFVKYIGDGDTKTFHSVCDAKPYGDIAIEKVECVGHIQKRMGTRLRKLKQEKKKLSDGKTLGGKGRLTDPLINEITSLYGNAIREHKDSLTDMRKAIWALFYHKISTDEKPIHDFCPINADTWCKYNKSRLEGISYHHKSPVPSVVMEAIKPIFKDLSDPSLLKRCLGGRTQNANESLNAMIWKFCPKTSGSGKKIVQIATNEATILFNEGCQGRHDVMDSLQLLRSNFSIHGFEGIDNKRIAYSERKASMQTKEQRKLRKRCKTAKDESLKEIEGEMYAAGGF